MEVCFDPWVPNPTYYSNPQLGDLAYPLLALMTANHTGTPASRLQIVRLGSLPARNVALEESFGKEGSGRLRCGG